MPDPEFSESAVYVAQPADFVMVIRKIDHAVFAAVERNIVLHCLLDSRGKDILKKSFSDVPDSFFIYSAGEVGV